MDPDHYYQELLRNVHMRLVGAVSQFLDRSVQISLVIRRHEPDAQGTATLVDPFNVLSTTAEQVVHRLEEKHAPQQPRDRQTGHHGPERILDEYWLFQSEGGAVAYVGWVITGLPAGVAEMVSHWTSAASQIVEFGALLNAEHSPTRVFNWDRMSAEFLDYTTTEGLNQYLQIQILQAKSADGHEAAAVRAFDLGNYITKLSGATEEGRPVQGRLCVTDIGLAPEIEFYKGWDATDIKHTCKLLGPTHGTEYYLVSDGKNNLGYGRLSPEQLRQSLIVHFERGQGKVFTGDTHLCTVSGSRVAMPISHADAARQVLEEHGHEPLSPSIIRAVQALISVSQTRGHGCSIVVSPDNADRFSGHVLKTPIDVVEMDKTVEALIAKLSGIDGSICVDSRGLVTAFGVLLDGTYRGNEDRARGARHNSALRYTADHPRSLVFVVSEDGPASIFFNGRDATPRPNADWSMFSRDQYREARRDVPYQRA